jgi:hypothetical protein
MKFIIFNAFLILTPVTCFAENSVIGNFTRSISNVYTTSKSCENSIGPGPKEYMQSISDYYSSLYPNGTSYWILPQNERIVTNRETCIVMMRNSLFNYKNASKAYIEYYPNRKRPPRFILYPWDKMYIEQEPIPQVIKPPVTAPANTRQKF